MMDGVFFTQLLTATDEDSPDMSTTLFLCSQDEMVDADAFLLFASMIDKDGHIHPATDLDVQLIGMTTTFNGIEIDRKILYSDMQPAIDIEEFYES
jgi:hypothetical protein